MFYCEFCEIFMNTFFYRTPPMTTSRLFFSILLPRPIDFFVKNSLKTSAPYAREQRTRFRFYFFQYISFGLSRKTMIQPWKVLSHCFFYRLHLVSGTEIRAISHGWWNCSRWRSERHVSRNQTPCKQENHFQWWVLKIKTYLFKVVFKTRKNAWNFINLTLKLSSLIFWTNFTHWTWAFIATSDMRLFGDSVHTQNITGYWKELCCWYRNFLCFAASKWAWWRY